MALMEMSLLMYKSPLKCSILAATKMTIMGTILKCHLTSRRKSKSSEPLCEVKSLAMISISMRVVKSAASLSITSRIQSITPLLKSKMIIEMVNYLDHRQTTLRVSTMDARLSIQTLSLSLSTSRPWGGPAKTVLWSRTLNSFPVIALEVSSRRAVTAYRPPRTTCRTRTLWWQIIQPLSLMTQQFLSRATSTTLCRRIWSWVATLWPPRGSCKVIRLL